jgi:hypothetical protein
LASIPVGFKKGFLNGHLEEDVQVEEVSLWLKAITERLV